MMNKDILGEPAICIKCGAVDSIHLYLNTETDELTVECEECGQEYESETAEAALRLLGEISNQEEKAWQAEAESAD